VTDGFKFTTEKAAGGLVSDIDIIPPDSTNPEKSEKIPASLLTEIQVANSTTHAMGVISIAPDGSRYINEVIIPKCSPIPCKFATTQNFFTTPDNSRFVDIYVLQGDKPRPLDNIPQFRFIVRGLRHSRTYKTSIRIQYEYDEIGCIKVRVRQENDDFDLPVETYNIPENMSWSDDVPIMEKIEIPQQPLINVLILIDGSGSMSGTPFKKALEAAVNLVEKIQNISENAKIGFGSFANNFKIEIRPTDEHKKVIEKIKKAQFISGGNAEPVFANARKILEDMDGAKIIVVLSDGIWNNQPLSIELANKCKKEADIDIMAVGFGSADRDFLSKVSTINDFVNYTTGPAGIIELFGNIAQSIQTNFGSSSNEYRTESADSIINFTKTW
jgi:molecular chaperone DnaK